MKKEIINENGEILSKLWFDYAYSFNDGFAKVKLNGEWYIINMNGEIIK